MLNSLEIKIGGGFGVTTFVGNLRQGMGTFDIAAIDQFGAMFPASFTIGPGSNFFTLSATNNELITDVLITGAVGSLAPTGFNEFAHPRISGASVIPEPSTWALMMVGFTGLGFVAFRRGRLSRPSGAMA
jgi:hypothetical protein